ncbi:ATPase family AAA domain-containing protein 5b [Polymixia lowei]
MMTDGTDAEITAGEDQALCKNTLDIKLAPIFLRTTQHISGKGRCKQSLEKRRLLPSSATASQRHDLQVVKHQHRISPPAHSLPSPPPPPPCTLTQRKGKVCSTRRELSVSGQQGCLEEIRLSNPVFPVRRVFSALQKKCDENVPDLISPEKTPYPSSLHLQPNHLGEKRKRQNEQDVSDKISKRPRSSLATEKGSDTGHCPPSEQGVHVYTESPNLKHRRSRLSRTYRLKRQRESGGLVNNHDLKLNPTDHTDSESQSPLWSPSLQRDSGVEDVLWTEKYCPRRSSEVIGNSASVNKLHSWLKKWKLRADCDERRIQREKKHEENSNGSWDCGDFQGEAVFEEEREEPLRNTVLITGPPGVGKTASVYACAQELGFKVFEVNCSSQRSGRHLVSQLKEATQSHLVETSGKHPLKPAYFNNYTNNSWAAKPVALPGKAPSLKNVISSSNKRGGKTLGRAGRKRKPGPATVTLANFFKMKANADDLLSGGPGESPEKPDIEESRNTSPSTDETTSRRKKTATSLILFEEVDVIFDDDVGFLAAVKTFTTTTKRPVVLTTSDPLFKERFDGSLDEVIFKTPSVVNVCSYLRLVCLAENVRTELGDVQRLARQSRGDVRRCLLQLQLWVHSGGGQRPQQGAPSKEPDGVHWCDDDEVEDSHLPPCDSGCTASMLGLHTVTQQSILNLLKRQSCTDPDNKLLDVLSESWRRGVPLLYSNLELLLPLPVSAQATPAHDPTKVACPGLHSEPKPPDIQPQIQQPDKDVDLKATTVNDVSVRTFSRLSRRKCMSTGFDSRSSSSVTLNLKPRKTSLSLKGIHLRSPSSDDKTKTERNATKLATRCLDALTDFTDLMSYLDATMPTAEAGGSEEFVWTGGHIEDGLLDEMREEEEGRGGRERLLEIQGAVEGLGFHSCWCRVSEVWIQAQRCRQELGDEEWGRLVEKLTFPVSSHRQSFSFSLLPLCKPSVAQRRFDLSRKVLRSRSFSLLGNRQAVGVDYLPVLRSVSQQQGRTPARCVNYLSNIPLGLSKSTIQLLAEDFS